MYHKVLTPFLVSAVILFATAGKWCTKDQQYNITVTESYRQSTQAKEAYACFPKLICERTVIEYHTRYRTVQKTRTRTLSACCAGWSGDDCDIACAPGTFGDGCTDICQCQNEATCHPADGSCVCKNGYKGTNCDQKCLSGTHGYYCQSECADCPVEQCHHVDGCVTPTDPPQNSDERVIETETQKSQPVGSVPESRGLGAPPGAQGEAGGRVSASKGRNGSDGVSIKIVLPVCLLVLIAILVVVIVFSKRRMAQVLKHTSSGDDVVVSYSAASRTEDCDVAALDNEANLCRQSEPFPTPSHTETADIQTGAAACSLEEGTQKCADLEDSAGLPAQMLSYKARMNDLNVGTTSSQSCESGREEKELNTDDGATVTILMPSSRYKHSKPTPNESCSLIAESQETKLSVDCDLSSDDEN